MELEELYPPRFLIDVCGTEALNTGHVWITFTGMATDFKSELILDKGGEIGTISCTKYYNMHMQYLHS